MRRIFLLAVISSFALSSLAVGSTLSLFSTHNSHPDHTYSTADLCITSVRAGEEATLIGPMFYISTSQPEVDKLPTGPWAPGDTASRRLRITNSCAGQSDGDHHEEHDAWSLLDPLWCLLHHHHDEEDTIDAVVKSVKASLQSPPETPSLADQLIVNIYTAGSGDQRVLVGTARLSALLAARLGLQYPAGSSGAKIPLDAGAIRDLEFEVRLDRTAGNQYQGKSIAVAFEVTAQQREFCDD